MNKGWVLCVLGFLVAAFLLLVAPVRAVTPSPVGFTQEIDRVSVLGATSTQSGVASEGAILVPTNSPVPAIPDITQSNVQAKSHLVAYLDDHPIQSLAPWNIVQHAIRRGVALGVPLNILVVLLLFPITASIIAIFRHVIGLRGFGVYTPAVLAVAFLSTGYANGLFLFAFVFIATTIGRVVLARLKLQYLPRTALLIWMVSTGMFGLMLVTPEVGITSISAVGIFPLLVLVLLSENFLDAQMIGTLRGAIQLALETLFLAVVSSFFMRALPVQEFVLLRPELTLVTVLLVNLLVGKYTGLRVMELLRFRSVLEPEE